MEFDFLTLCQTLEFGQALLVVLGAQTASTDNFLNMFGHGFAKLLLDTATEHFCCPMHFWQQGKEGENEDPIYI